MGIEARLIVRVTNFVNVDQEGEAIHSCYGFTVWDGENNHFFVSSSDWFPSAADVFNQLRGPNALALIESIDNYHVGFAELAKMAGRFWINALAAPDYHGEVVEVDERPRCFGEYSHPYLNTHSVHTYHFDCDEHCSHNETCEEKSGYSVSSQRRPQKSEKPGKIR